MKKNLFLSVSLMTLLLVGCDSQISIPSTSNNEPSTSTSTSSGNSLVDALNYSKEHYFGVQGAVYSTYNDGNEPVDIESFDLHNIFNEKVVYNNTVYHYEIDDVTYDDPYTNVYFAKDDGFAYQRQLTLQNTVEDVPVSTRTTNNVKFSEYFASPFKNLAYSDLVKINGEYLIKPQISSTFSTGLVLQTITAKKALLSVKDGRFDKITIYTDSYSTIIGGVYSSYRFELTFNWDEEASIPEVKPFEHKEINDTLETAIYNLYRDLNNHNFTAKTSLTTNSGNSVGYFYATKDAVYSNAIDSSNKTYGVKREGNYFYEFAVTTSSSGEQKVTVYDDDSIDESEIYPNYRSFSADLFEASSDGKTFTLYDGFESSVINLIAPYTEASYYATYITLLEINLNSSNKFESLYFEYYDSINNINAKATITYESINETELPINL